MEKNHQPQKDRMLSHLEFIAPGGVGFARSPLQSFLQHAAEVGGVVIVGRVDSFAKGCA